MNTFNIILTLTVPIFVVGYIVYDLLVSKHVTVKNIEMSCDKKDNSKIRYEGSRKRNQNDGKYFSRKEILENAQYIITKMSKKNG